MSGEVVIPFNPANEQVLIAAAIVSGAARAELLGRLRPDYFQDGDHAEAWRAITKLAAQDHEPTPAAISQLTGGRVDRVYLEDVVRANPKPPSSFSFHIEALHWDTTRAKAVQGPLAELIKLLQDPAASPERVRSLSSQLGVAFHGSSLRTHVANPKTLVHQHTQVIAERMKGVGLHPTGIEGLDFYPEGSVDDSGRDITGTPLLVPGMEPGKITVVTAISGGGKSTFTAALALEQARIRAARGHGKVLFGAWEMTCADVLELMACISLGLSRGRVKTGRISAAELKLLTARMEQIAEWVTLVDMPFHRERGVKHTPDEVLDVVHGYIADSGADFAIFDIWKRAFRKLKDESDEADALERQRVIALETGCHCVLVQQQRLKDIETRQNPTPTREGIKGSSAWVDVADTILGIHIPGLMSRVARNVFQVHILKQRYGIWPLTVEYKWDGDLVKMTSPQLVWNAAYGDETRAQGGGRSTAPLKKGKDLAALSKTSAKKPKEAGK